MTARTDRTQTSPRATGTPQPRGFLVRGHDRIRRPGNPLGLLLQSETANGARSRPGVSPTLELQALRSLHTPALRDEGALDEPGCLIDATCSSVKGGGAEIGPTKRGKDLKTMAIVDRHGLPLAVSTHAANHHEVTLVQLGFDCYIIEARPENLTGDRAYDRDKLDEELRQDGIEMIAPHRQNRVRPGTSAP